jgi:hypothetical protein
MNLIGAIRKHVLRKSFGSQSTESPDKRFKEILKEYDIKADEAKYLFPVKHRDTIPKNDSDFNYMVKIHFLPVYDEWQYTGLLDQLDDRYSEKKFITIEDVNQMMADRRPRSKGGRETMTNLFIMKKRKNGGTYHTFDSYVVEGDFIESEVSEQFESTGVTTVADLLLFLPLNLTDDTIDEVGKKTDIVRLENILVDQGRLYQYIETMATKEGEALPKIIKSVSTAADGIDWDFEDSVTRIYECICESG